MSKWSYVYGEEIAKAGSVESFVFSRISYKKRLIKAICKHASKSGRILEIGCGSGASLAFLGSLGYSVSGIDSDVNMIRIAKEVVGFSNNKVDIRVGDLFNWPDEIGFQDLVFSNGVLEHFSNERIVEAIQYCLSKSETVIISVPTNYFSNSQRIHGDERFLSVKFWKKIINDSGAECLETFGFCFKNKVLETIYCFTRGLFPIRPPFIGFVLKKSGQAKYFFGV
ncbi:MAG: class I SAM-dependent methyltransferase [Patescibacteria group bacterium]|nr:class I SAM-dependent methyltransferase [Patescibacteria group bacterium]